MSNWGLKRVEKAPMTGKAAVVVVVEKGAEGGSFAGEREREGGEKLRSYALPCNERVRLNRKKYTEIRY